MTDRLGISDYPVPVTSVTGFARQKLLARLDVMQRELRHQETAIATIRRLTMGMPQSSGFMVAAVAALTDMKSLTDGVTNSRNWTLSLAMSHCYIQTALFPQSPDILSALGLTKPSNQLRTLFGRAVDAGVADGDRDQLLSMVE